jgi:succinyl-CoA synthetase beta subunit
MKIHEYQAKSILKEFDVPIQDGYVISNLEDAKKTIKKVQNDFNTEDVIVKAQIHAGGRGKGGGIKYSKNLEDALDNCNKVFNMQLITHQTDKKGQKVRKIMITEAFDIKNEFYVALTLDRALSMDVFMVSTEGGMDIEEVAKDTPEKIRKVWINPAVGFRSFQAQYLASILNLEKSLEKNVITVLKNIYRCYKANDASLVEINPLIETQDSKIIALDAKFNLDQNALYRNKLIADMRDIHEEDPTEAEAGRFGLNYIKLDGNVGCMVNGAGLAMATMDIIKTHGGEPANFLDVGGAANVDTVKNGFKIILSDPNVKSILINIFGGIVRCDRVANGVVQAVSELDLKVPVIVRLEGTNNVEAKKILADSGLDIIPATTMNDAATKAVNATI